MDKLSQDNLVDIIYELPLQDIYHFCVASKLVHRLCFSTQKKISNKKLAELRVRIQVSFLLAYLNDRENVQLHFLNKSNSIIINKRYLLKKKKIQISIEHYHFDLQKEIHQPKLREAIQNILSLPRTDITIVPYYRPIDEALNTAIGGDVRDVNELEELILYFYKNRAQLSIAGTAENVRYQIDFKDGINAEDFKHDVAISEVENVLDFVIKNRYTLTTNDAEVFKFFLPFQSLNVMLELDSNYN